MGYDLLLQNWRFGAGANNANDVCWTSRQTGQSARIPGGIELGEIEQQLAQLPGIRDALVVFRVGSSNSETGKGNTASKQLSPMPLRKPLMPTIILKIRTGAPMAQQVPEYMVPSACNLGRRLAASPSMANSTKAPYLSLLRPTYQN